MDNSKFSKLHTFKQEEIDQSLYEYIFGTAKHNEEIINAVLEIIDIKKHSDRYSNTVVAEIFDELGIKPNHFKYLTRTPRDLHRIETMSFVKHTDGDNVIFKSYSDYQKFCSYIRGKYGSKYDYLLIYY